MSILCLSVCRLCVPNIMTLGICLKKIHLIKVVAFCWYNVKNRVIFDVQFESWKVDKKKQTYIKTESYKLCSSVFWILLPNVTKIDPYNFELYRFKVGAFFWDSVTTVTSCILKRSNSQLIAGTVTVEKVIYYICEPQHMHRILWCPDWQIIPRK